MFSNCERKQKKGRNKRYYGNPSGMNCSDVNYGFREVSLSLTYSLSLYLNLSDSLLLSPSISLLIHLPTSFSRSLSRLFSQSLFSLSVFLANNSLAVQPSIAHKMFREADGCMDNTRQTLRGRVKQRVGDTEGKGERRERDTHGGERRGRGRDSEPGVYTVSIPPCRTLHTQKPDSRRPFRKSCAHKSRAHQSRDDRECLCDDSSV